MWRGPTEGVQDGTGPGEEAAAEEDSFDPPQPPWGKDEWTEEEWASAVEKATQGAGNCPQDEAMVRDLLQEYRDIFPKEIDVSRPLRAAEVAIHTVHEAPIAFPNRRRYTPEQLAAIKTQIQKLVVLGILEESSSTYNAPIVMVRKGEGWRMCHDFRRLNEQTIPMVVTIPTVTDVFDRLPRARFLSKIDCTSAYFQLRIAEKDRKKTAFATAIGTFQYRVCPFGLRNLPSEFNAAIARIFVDLEEVMAHFFDDFVVHSEAMEFNEHVAVLRRVFERCRENQVQLSIRKTFLGKRKVELLGFMVGYQEVGMTDQSLAAVGRLQPPTTTKGVQQFLGLASFFRQRVYAFAERARPLSNLLRTGIRWCWGEEEQNAFEDLKNALLKAPVLKIPLAPGRKGFQPFVLFTDASDSAIAGILTQPETPASEATTVKAEPSEKMRALGGRRVEELRPCHYFSRVLTGAEKRYTVTERECLAVVAAVKKFAFYLSGAPFLVVTDHRALEYLNGLEEPCGRLSRWILALQQFAFDIVHRPGTEMAHVDALTRMKMNPGDKTAGTVLLVRESESVMMGWKAWVREETIPKEGDTVGRRPDQTTRRTGQSVLQVGDPSRGETALVVGVRRKRGADELGGAGLPRGVWHEEPWLSSALIESIRAGKMVDIPRRFQERLRRDVENTRIEFGGDPVRPQRIQVRRTDGKGRGVWLECPPPSKRLDLIVEAHIVGHRGVEKTKLAVEDAGFTWVGIDGDATQVVQRCMRRFQSRKLPSGQNNKMQ